MVKQKINNIIEVKNLTKKYGNQTALDDLSFEVHEKEILGLLGPNGSGKSTCINCLLSLLKFQKGTINIMGREMNPDSYDIKKQIGVVFQDVAVFDELTVYENIDYFCGLYIKDKEERKAMIQDAISLVGLEDFKKFRPKQLSGGLLRRLNIACGIAHKPKLIYLDEPTVAVDPQSRNNILEGIKKLNQQGATIIYTTHYMEEAEQLCNRIIIIDHGKIVAQGTKESLKDIIDIEEKVTLEALSDVDRLIELLKKTKNISKIEKSLSTVEIYYRKGTHNISDLVDLLKKEKITYHRIFSELPTLNDVFLELTGTELRD